MAASTTEDEIKVYWIPGCGNCTRLKGYLHERGISFTAVNVQEDLSAFDEMKSAGIMSIPWVRKGHEWAPGADLDRVEKLVGLVRDPTARELSVEEIVARACRLIGIASGLAEQLPADHYADKTPTLEKYAGAFFYFDDGRPYIPHSTFKGLVHHILGHAEKLKRLALMSDGNHPLGTVFKNITGEDAAFGELDQATPMYQVVAQMRLAGLDLGAWLVTPGPRDLSIEIDTDWGIQTILQLMQTMTCSLAQHSRQLTEVLSRFAIEPHDPIGAADLEGLRMPSAIWE